MWVAGTFFGTASFGATQLTSTGAGSITAKADTFVARLDAPGNVLGAFRLGDANDDTLQAMALDPKSGDLVLLVQHGPQGSVSKISPTGEERWTKPIVGTTDGGGNALVLDGSGDVFVGGAIDGRAAILRFDGSGNEKWRRVSSGGPMTSGNLGSGAHAIAIAADGGVLAGGALDPGTQIDFGGGALAVAADQAVGAFVVELGADGTHRCSHVWTTKMGPPPPEGSFAAAGAFARAVAYTGPTSYVVGGSFGGVLDVGKGPMTSAGGHDFWVADFDR